MDLFDSKRQERLEAARKAATASKEAALKFLIDAGILVPNGEVGTTFKIIWISLYIQGDPI